MTPEFKALGEMIEADPKLKARVVVAKVRLAVYKSLNRARSNTHAAHANTPHVRLASSAYADPKNTRLVAASAAKCTLTNSQVNADEHRSLGEKFEVRGFPTIKFFPRGKVPGKDTSEK